MGHFINYEDTIGDIRLAINKSVESELKEHCTGLFNHTIVLSELDAPLYFIQPTEIDGKSRAKSIYYDGQGVVIKTDAGECVDFMDLETDDMVAVYNFVHYELN